MKRFLKENGLALGFGLIFVLALVGQSFAGHAVFDDEQVSARLEPIGYLAYVTSSSFAADVAENWQSEYLQFFLYIGATIWLVQRGSPESKRPGDEGPGSDADQRVGRYAGSDSPRSAAAEGLRQVLYVAAFDEQQIIDLQRPVTWAEYLLEPDFWNRTLQNWQSEFLAVGSMVALSIYLRQSGSPESKPVGASHAHTGT
ncbi:hypothetical protein ITJ64_15330 [Herbiconiux sp. VKM Ac-1786]|uniref:DUF6766 family protein n=1 Tax=Herbiconiux sp. VKM Ac-1786 TaxID=2783824 RepID=UPI00188D0B02|nr:DUF6766 family protein [Herbiconiux sp. VKM Ac-1786]MBF4573889.1 hypothetical protein [Herbiconiux sp. VKM Ac-1786]